MSARDNKRHYLSSPLLRPTPPHFPSYHQKDSREGRKEGRKQEKKKSPRNHLDALGRHSRRKRARRVSSSAEVEHLLLFGVLARSPAVVGL